MEHGSRRLNLQHRYPLSGLEQASNGCGAIPTHVQQQVPRTESKEITGPARITIPATAKRPEHPGPVRSRSRRKECKGGDQCATRPIGVRRWPFAPVLDCWYRAVGIAHCAAAASLEPATIMLRRFRPLAKTIVCRIGRDSQVRSGS